MCGRFAIGVDAATLVEVFELAHASAYTPHDDVAPTMVAPVILDSVKRGGWTAEPFRWGLVPAFADALSFGRRTFNARSETAASKPAFRNAAARRRCVVPVSAYFEWQKVDGGKQKHRVTAGAGLSALAGLWERWRDPNGAPVHTFSILTRDAPESIAWLHDRAPVRVARDDIGRWLDPSWTDGEAAVRWVRERDPAGWTATPT